MKKILFAASLLTTTFAFVACGSDATNDGIDSPQQRQIDSLYGVIAEQSYAIDERDSLMAMLNEVDSTFAQLESEYTALQKMDRKNPEANRRRITDRMAALQETMASNKEKIRQLNGRIKTLNNQNNDLQAYIARLEERSAAQEAQIAELLTELENSKVVIKGLNQNVTELTASNQEKDQYIARQIADANRAWFIVGTYEELKEAGIVAKSGGFIGIGRKQGTVANMNTDKFTEIDRTKVTTITLNLKKPMLVTQHPEGSYEFVADEENPKVTAYLHILDPIKFWQYTDYLVVSTK